MTLRKDSLVFGIFMTIVLPMAWSAPLPFGALDEVQPSKLDVKKEKPARALQASRSREALVKELPITKASSHDPKPISIYPDLTTKHPKEVATPFHKKISIYPD